MQRLFSNFASGLPGLGLLVLRLVLAGFLIVDGMRVLTRVGGGACATNGTFGLLLVLCAAFVAAGFLTPIAQAIVVIVHAAALANRWFAFGFDVMASGPWQIAIFEAAIAASLALTGPGAHSVDARLFGRQEIKIPPPTPPRSF